MSITVLDRTGHMTTCTKYCAVKHCRCGKLAMHGRSSCATCLTARRDTQTIVECTQCDDMKACREHVGRKVACARCVKTGNFITGTLNGKPVGPGGKCYRCNGKGHHTPEDRKRNDNFERFGRRY